MGNDASEKKDQEERIRENGQVTLGGGRKGRIHLLSIIGEIEGHENLSGSTKTTKYEHVIPQLAAVQAGRLEDWELEGARSTLLNAYASMGDSQGKLENFYLGQAATGQEDTPELLAEQVRHVTAERIFDAMQTASLDTVYFLKGKETAE
mgnify:CR=1 FL=1